MLKTEQNTRKIENEIRRAAVLDRIGASRHLQTDFEHGQWWVTNKLTGAQWSVVDTNDGFGFELVTRGDDED